MKKLTCSSLRLVLPVVSIAFLSANSFAAWTYNRVIDSLMTAPSGTFQSFGSNIQMEGKNVVGSMTYNGINALFKANSLGSYATIAKVGDAAPSGTLSSFGVVGIGGGSTAFRGTYGASQSVFLDNGTTRTVIASTGQSTAIGTLSTFGAARTNGSMVAFVGSTASLASGVFTKIGSTLSLLKSTSDVSFDGSNFTSFGNTSVSGNNVSFQGFTGNGGVVNFFWNGSALQTIIKNGDVIPGFGAATGMNSPTVSGNNAAFASFGPSNSQGIFRWNGSSFTTIALKGQSSSIGTLNSFSSNVFINGNTVVYNATNAGGQRGIFIGDGIKTETVIKVGDSLFGSTVTALTNVAVINDDKQVAFGYTLANGRFGVALAVPEPTSMIALGAGALALLRRRRKASK